MALTTRAPWNLPLAVLTLLSATTASAATLTLTALDARTGEPVAGVVLTVPGSPRIAVTDSAGTARLASAPGTLVVSYSHIGYRAGSLRVSMDSLDASILVALAPQPIRFPEQSVEVERDLRQPGETRIAGGDLMENPTLRNDPLRLLKVLPGVTSNNDFANLYNVRGGNPDQNLLYINGIEIETPFLLRRGIAGTLSMLNPAMIDSMSFLAGSFPVRYGDRLSSVVDAAYGLDAEEAGGTIQVSGTTQSVTMRARPQPFASFISGARHADLSRHARALQVAGPVRPTFWDLQTLVRLDTPTSEVRLFAATLNSRFLRRPRELLLRYNCSILKSPKKCDEFRGTGQGQEVVRYADDVIGVTISTGVPFGTITLYANATRKDESEDTDVRFEITQEVDQIILQDGLLTTEVFESSLRRQRVETGILGSRPSGNGVATWGVGARYARVRGRVTRSETIAFSGGVYSDEGDVRLHRSDLDGFAFIEKTRQAERLRTSCGLRLAWLGSTGEALLMPRISMRYRLTSGLNLTLSAGRHAQPPVFKEYLHDGTSGGARVRAQRSDQIGTGFDIQVRNALWWSNQVYYRHQWRMISYQVEDLRVSYSGENDSRGFVLGADSQFRGQMGSLVGIAGYGFLIAKEDLSGDGRGYIPRASDQRHTVSLYVEDRMPLESIRLPRPLRSRMHLRLLLGTGFPSTPKVRGTGDGGQPQLVDGRRNSRRARPYFRFDLGTTQSVTLAGKTLHVRQEIANLFDQYNVLGYSYLPSPGGEPVEVRNSLGRRVYNLAASLEL